MINKNNFFKNMSGFDFKKSKFANQSGTVQTTSWMSVGGSCSNGYITVYRKKIDTFTGAEVEGSYETIRVRVNPLMSGNACQISGIPGSISADGYWSASRKAPRPRTNQQLIFRNK